MYSFKFFKKGGRNLGVVEYHDVFEVGDGGFCNVETAVHDPNRFARRIQTGQKFMMHEGLESAAPCAHCANHATGKTPAKLGVRLLILAPFGQFVRGGNNGDALEMFGHTFENTFVGQPRDTSYDVDGVLPFDMPYDGVLDAAPVEHDRHLALSALVYLLTFALVVIDLLIQVATSFRHV